MCFLPRIRGKIVKKVVNYHCLKERKMWKFTVPNTSQHIDLQHLLARLKSAFQDVNWEGMCCYYKWEEWGECVQNASSLLPLIQVANAGGQHQSDSLTPLSYSISQSNKCLPILGWLFSRNPRGWGVWAYHKKYI